MNEPERQIMSILGEAVEYRSPEERAAFLAKACAGDAGRQARVEALLRAYEAAGNFLQGDPPPRVPVATVDVPPVRERPGDVIGPYKLLEPIGEGGFGVVFLAEQTEPVRRKVALKVLKPGMDTRQVIARFEAERQALAIMDHPHIAKVFDGGATSSGRPYFVMELVKGVPITEFCDQHHWTPRQRLELFIPVCRAVQHAHQKGIIHRDLKPSNVLVSRHDATPVVKVIDFGVAKALGQELTDKTLFTGFAQMVGTPLYMSPEQAGMSDLDVDTRSDIYALGVLLYELLAGTTPFIRERFQRAAYDEIRRIIREEDPPRPSTRLSESKDTLPSISAQRDTEPAKLTKLVRGELDWIVMKALEKDRNRRYETASAFAADVRRYLHDEPVAAGPPSAWYRFRKFARRNKVSLAVAALVLFFLLLLGSGVGWVWRDRAARQAEQTRNLERAVERAEFLQREGKRGEALAALERVQLLAREAEPAPPLAGRIDSLQQLLNAEGRDEAFVARFEAIRREVLTEVDLEESAFRGDTAYPRLREALEHWGIAVGIAPPATAVAHIQKSPPAIQTAVITALDECFFWVPATDADAREWLIEVLRMADNDPWRNKVRPAWKQPGVLEALATDIDVHEQPPSFLLHMARALPKESPSRLDLERRVQFAHPDDFWANHHLGFDLAGTGKHPEAIRYYTAALALRPDNPGVLLNRALSLSDVRELEAAIADLRRAIAVAPRYAAAHNNLGIALRGQKKWDAAIAAHRKAIEIDAKYAGAHLNLGFALSAKGALDEAVDAYRKAVELDPSDAIAHVNLGHALLDQKKPDEAVDALCKAVELDPNNADFHYNLGIALSAKGALDEAVDAYRKAVELDPSDAIAYVNLGNALLDQKKLDAAIAAYRKAVELDLRDAIVYVNLGHALSMQGRQDAAIAAYRKAIELDPSSAGAHNNLGIALYGQKKLDEAIAAFRKAIELDPNSAIAHINLGSVLRDQEKLDEAIAAFRKAIELDPKLTAAYCSLGAILCDHLNDYDRAIECFRKAIELDPKHARAHKNLCVALVKQGWDLVNRPDPKARDPRRALESVQEAIELDPRSEWVWQQVGWVRYRTEDWRASIEALEKSCKLGDAGTGDCAQWIVLALAHARLAAQEGLPEEEREHHRAEARRRYEEADKQIDSWWRVRPGDVTGQAIWDFRAEARELMAAKEGKE